VRFFAAILPLVASAAALAVVQQEIKVSQLDPAICQEYAGNFQIARDRIISIGPFSEAGGYPVFFDSKTRRFGVLYPVSQNRFVTGTLQDGAVIPADLQVTFERSAQGAVSSITWREGNEGELRGLAVSPHRNEEVIFRNGDVTLHGTLTLPTSPPPHPAVIFLHEAGPRSRPFGVWPYLFAHYGIAMLTFDKRGSGASNGSWQTASFEDLAGDALAAVRLLRDRPDIDRRKIGLWSNSNSGWFVPLAAAHSSDVAFIISRVGSSLPPTENILYEIENQMRDQGFSEDEIRKAVALRDQLQKAILTNQGWAEFVTAAHNAQNERWFAFSRVASYVAKPLPPDAATREGWRKPIDFDPIPYWQNVTCPVLAIYGGRDHNTPAERNIPPLLQALNRAGNRDYTILVLPSDHFFYEYEVNHQGYTVPIPSMQKYVPGYVDGMINWLLERVKMLGN
jgi:dienelactone hydrolase